MRAVGITWNIGPRSNMRPLERLLFLQWLYAFLRLNVVKLAGPLIWYAAFIGVKGY